MIKMLNINFVCNQLKSKGKAEIANTGITSF